MIIELENVNEKTWNAALIEAGSSGTIFQSTHWAKYLNKTYGDRPTYIASTNGKGNIDGLLLAIESCFAKHPTCNSSYVHIPLFGLVYRKAMSPFMHRILPFIFWENGPVVLRQSTASDNRDPYYEILEKIIAKANQRGCYEIKCARPAFFKDLSSIFMSLGFCKRRMGTLLVNVEQSPDLMWSKIQRHSRKNIERLQQTVEIAKASHEYELKEFHELHIETSKRANVKTYPFSYFKSLWDCFSEHNMIAVFIARIKDKPIGGSLSLMFNNIIHEYVLAESNYARSSELYSGDILKWHTMNWAHEKGFKHFDLTGVEFYKIDAGDQKAKNIFRYKSKWGGQLVEFNDYSRLFARKRKIVSMLNRHLADSL